MNAWEGLRLGIAVFNEFFNFLIAGRSNSIIFIENDFEGIINHRYFQKLYSNHFLRENDRASADFSTE